MARSAGAMGRTRPATTGSTAGQSKGVGALVEMLAARSPTPRLQHVQDAQAVGRSRGGRTSKIHALADACDRPVAFVLTPGNIADITVAPVLLHTVAAPARECQIFW